jgi:putative ABC transport system permease protein
MEIRPILSALLRNRAGAVLVAIQIAITLAIVVNAVYVVKQRVELVGRPTGIDETNQFAVRVSGFSRDFDFFAMVREDLALLRGMPGVVAASPIGAVPLSGSGSSTRLFAEPNEKGLSGPINYFETDHEGVNALGLKLAAGKTFDAQSVEYRAQQAQKPPASGQIIVTKAYGEKLWPGQDAHGKTLYDNQSNPMKVVGVIDHMQGSWLGWDEVNSVALMPVVGPGNSVNYLIRTTPGEIDRVMAAAESALKKANESRVVGELRKLSNFKQRSYSSDTLMVVILGVVTGLVLVFSALGIFGLATFNVNTRTRQIGTRRAIGARRSDIVRYFMIENWMVTTLGVLVGCALALLGGAWLAQEYGLERLDLYYLVGGVLGLWLVGQFAAWQPALKASKVSPAMATKTI